MDRYTSQGSTEPEKSGNANFNQKTKDNMKRTAAEASEKIRSESKGKAESARQNAADQLDEYTHVTESIAQTLHDEHHETLSAYVSEIAGYVSNISNGLRDKSADDLMRDAKSMAQNNPALFIAGSVAIGLGIARLARTGVENSSQHDSGMQQNSSQGFDPDSPERENDAWPAQTPYIADSTSPASSTSDIPDSAPGVKEPFKEPV